MRRTCQKECGKQRDRWWSFRIAASTQPLVHSASCSVSPWLSCPSLVTTWSPLLMVLFSFWLTCSGPVWPLTAQKSEPGQIVSSFPSPVSYSSWRLAPCHDVLKQDHRSCGRACSGIAWRVIPVRPLLQRIQPQYAVLTGELGHLPLCLGKVPLSPLAEESASHLPGPEHSIWHREVLWQYLLGKN